MSAMQTKGPVRDEDRQTLLQIARACVRAEVDGMAGPPLPAAAGVLGEQRGCFVTLTNRGRLRGCIGTFHPSKPLLRQVAEMASAAARDPRFVRNPITAREVGELTVQVSVLSELELTDDPLKLELGVHGIYIVRGYSAGCFLPEVATETGWSREEFLSQCCAGKAGMAPDAWRQPGTKVYLFSSEKFAEQPDGTITEGE